MIQSSTKKTVALSVMMFFQYLLFMVWWVPMAAFLSNMGVSEGQKALILSSMAIGCVFSPVVGVLADRYFRSDRLLGVLNLITAVMLIIASFQTSGVGLMITLTLAMCAYMPTWSLTSSIALCHTKAENLPRVRLWGSIGNVASGVFSFAAMYLFDRVIDGTIYPLYCGIAVTFVAAVLNFVTLPPTYPTEGNKGKVEILDLFGLRVLRLAKDRNILFFFLISLLFMIPFAVYWSYASQFLQEVGFKFITITINWGPVFEIFIMMLIPIILRKVGYKWLMVLGLAMLMFRYLFFSVASTTDMQWMLFGAIFIHGFIYGCFMLGGQMYIDRVAPSELRSQAQGFFFLLTMGVGLLIGNIATGQLMEMYELATPVNGLTVDWGAIFGVTAAFSGILLLMMVLFFRSNIKVDD